MCAVETSHYCAVAPGTWCTLRNIFKKKFEGLNMDVVLITECCIWLETLYQSSTQRSLSCSSSGSGISAVINPQCSGCWSAPYPAVWLMDRFTCRSPGRSWCPSTHKTSAPSTCCRARTSRCDLPALTQTQNIILYAPRFDLLTGLILCIRWSWSPPPMTQSLRFCLKSWLSAQDVFSATESRANSLKSRGWWRRETCSGQTWLTLVRLQSVWNISEPGVSDFMDAF